MLVDKLRTRQYSSIQILWKLPTTFMLAAKPIITTTTCDPTSSFSARLPPQLLQESSPSPGILPRRPWRKQCRRARRRRQKKLAWPTNTQPTINAAPAAKYSTGSAGMQDKDTNRINHPNIQTPTRLLAHPHKIIQTQQVIDQLYASSDPQFAKQAQDFLHTLQKQPYAWELAPQLLASPSINCQFFGAHTFQVKISRDWYRDLALYSFRAHLQEYQALLGHNSGGPYPMATTGTPDLAHPALLRPPRCSHEMAPLYHGLLPHPSVRCAGPGQESTQREGHTTRVPDRRTGGGQHGGSDRRPEGQDQSGTPGCRSPRHYDPPNLPRRAPSPRQCRCRGQAEGVAVLPELGAIRDPAALTMSLLPVPALFEPAADALLEVMSHPTHSSFLRLCEDVLVCVTSEWAQGEFARCVNENDDQSARTLCRIMTSFGESYTDFIARHLLRGDVISYLDMMIGFAGFPGHFGADQEISEIPLNFWYDLQESLVDAEVLGGGGGNGDDEELVDPEETAKRIVREEEARRAREAAYLVYRKLVGVLRMKVEYPLDEEWAGWTKDLKDRFRIFRRDVGDTLINSYHVLRDQMLAILVDMAIAQLNLVHAMRWQALESTLFCVKCISEAVPSHENVYMTRVFGPEIFGRLPAEGSHRLRNTALLVIGILTSLPPLSSHRLLRRVAQVSPRVPPPGAQLPHPCGRPGGRDGIQGRVRRVSGFADRWNWEPDKYVCRRWKERAAEGEAEGDRVDRRRDPSSATGEDGRAVTDPAHAQPLILSQLEYLTACCRGIQSPDDDYQSSLERTALYDQFASGNFGSVFERSDPARALLTAVGEITQEVAAVWGGDEEVMRALCHFLDTGIRTTSPLLSVPFPQLVHLIQTSYQRHPYACWLDTASQVVAVYGGRDGHGNVLRDLVTGMASKTLEGIRSTEAMEQYPDVVSSFLNLLSRVIRRCPLAFYQLPGDMLDTILMFAVAGMGLQERLALKSALSFMVCIVGGKGAWIRADFVGQEYESNPELAKLVETVMMNLGMRIMQELLAGIGGRLPRSLGSQLIDVLYKLVSRYVEASRQWLQVLLAQDTFPSPYIDQSSKEAFAKGILGTRSPRRFREVVQEFSLKCRKLEDTAFGAAV
ncbi:armadillo-type protein [Jimgerdemannia flammicorona]|uniref:Armadillo-type protein n=1 Tax=Jimgerdemannia flammicorona TaxID=994334 RepID=A0A433QZS6_9FUNG|nr:armadillo-type protein [Jimgerdemannia flammicorona]